MLKGSGKLVLYLVGTSADIVTLRLSSSTAILSDEQGYPWLDLRFDEQILNYDWSSTERINLAILRKILSADYRVMSAQSENDKVIWYQLEINNQTKLLQPKKLNATWHEPDNVPDIIYLARTASLTADDRAVLADYLHAHPNCRLICDQPLDLELAKLADWVLLTATNRGVALRKIRRYAAVRRIFVQNATNWWLAAERTVLEGEISLNFPDTEWLRLILALSFCDLSLEDQAGLITAGIKQIEAGQSLSLEKIDLDYVDFERLRILSGKANFNRRLHRLRRVLLDKQSGLVHLDNPGEISKQFKIKNYVHLLALLLKQNSLRQQAVLLLDPQVVAGFDSLKLPNDIFLAIRADAGFERLPSLSNEKVTTGLDGLDKRLVMYRQHGFDLASWRLVFNLEQDLSDMAILSNAHLTARFVKIAQDNGIFPLIELKISGSDSDKLNRLIRCLMQEMKLFKIDLSLLALVVTANLKTWQPSPELAEVLIFSEESLSFPSLPLLRRDLQEVLDLSSSLPLTEVIPEIERVLAKILTEKA